MDKLRLFVNEKEVKAESIEGAEDWNLASFLRNALNLTGTKISCGVGGCGSCTVLVSRYNAEDKTVSHNSVNACLTPLYSLNDCHILTVEGLSDTKSYHKIQEALALGNATQCGYCSPGIVMSMFGMEAQDSDNKSDQCISKVKAALQGNLCRCTGYRPILEAFYQRSQCQSTCEKASDGCCQGKGSGDIEDAGKGGSKQSLCIENLRKVNIDNNGVIKRIEDTLTKAHLESVSLIKKFTTSTKSSWVVPTSMAELQTVLKGCTTFKIVSGATSDEFWKSTKANPNQTVIDVNKVREMRCVELTDNYLKLGGSLTIDEMQKELQAVIGKLPERKTKVLNALLKMIDVYASGQVRKSATIGGSLMVTSNASDLQTAFFGLGLGKIEVKVLEGQAGESTILSSIQIPLNESVEFAWYDKIRRRKDFDLALINVGVKAIRIGESEVEYSICFGGTLLRRFRYTEAFSGIRENDSIPTAFESNVKNKIVQHICPEQLKLNPSIESFVETSAISLLKKFHLSMTKPEENASQCSRVFRSTRILTKPLSDQPSTNLVHREVPHASAIKHTTGEAKYCDDIPKFQNELELEFVLSTKPHAKILAIDFSKAVQVDGIVGTVTNDDLLPGRTKYGLVEQDEEIFASSNVTCYGQIIAGIVANTRAAAIKAASLVKVEYEEMEPVVFTEEDAIKHKSYFSKYDFKLTKGDCESVFDKDAEYNIITGEEKVGSQEHFYMEPQSCIVIPRGEEQELEIISSTQNPTGVQMQVATVLNIPAHRVVVKVKRVGGGFGGKESRCLMIALPTAVAAQKFGRPVRCVLSRETDMLISGKRVTYLTRHKLAFDNDGRLLALQLHVYIGAGNTIDVSMAEIERVALNIDNAYNIPNLDFRGYICKSNRASNTVMRGTGGPQAVFLIENIFDTIASYVKKEPCQVRSLQIYKDDDFTPYGQSLKGCNVLKCWQECITTSEYVKKREEVEAFNRSNSYVKRGISINPSNYGVGFTVLHLNQGAALVHIYTDGTVLISHSGVEIGQGVHTKMIQIATSVLGVPGNKIRIMETATDKVPNTTPSSASMTTDLNGGAVVDACQILMERLKPYKEEKTSWEDAVMKAYMDRVSLSATGFYKVPEMGWDAAAVHGNPFSYFTSGAACTVVELDCLTGQFQILSTDIVMDVGKSLNPGIDVGQIEGAFMQGVGLFLLEELVYDENGRLVTAGPLTYKIPAINDTPLEFNVSFLLGPGNSKAVYSSKAIGEPPILLATSAFFAVKHAIRAFRQANGKDVNFRLDSPATVEKILLACHTLFEE